MKKLPYKTRGFLIGGLLLCAPILSFGQSCCVIVSTYLGDGIAYHASYCDNPASNTSWVTIGNYCITC